MSLFKRTETVLVSPCQDYFLIKFPLTEERKEQVKEATGATWDRDYQMFKAPVGPEQFDALQKLRFRFTEEAESAAKQSTNRINNLIELSKASDAELHLEGFGRSPFPFQRAGIKYALNRKRVIIGDEMGLGKTIQALATVWALNAFPCLVITPASIKDKWAEKDIPPACPGKSAFVANKKTSEEMMLMCDFTVTNYEQLVGAPAFTDPTKKEVRLSPLGQKILDVPFKSIILDEAHYIKDPTTARALACMKIRKGIPIRLLLTGTPMMNQPSEFYSLLKFLDRIDEFGGFYGFMNEWCGMERGKKKLEMKKGFRTVPLNERLRSTCYVRRRKKEVWKDLPPKTRISYSTEITNRDEYDRAKKQLLEWVKERVLRDKEFLASIAHLTEDQQQFRIKERQADKAERAAKAEVIVRMGALKRVASEGKVEAAKKWIDEFLENGEKLVVFATNEFMIDALLTWYPDAARILSTTKDRQAEVDKFNLTDCQLLIGAMGTSAANSPAGVGHNLTSGTNVLFLQLGWNPALHDQCEDRCYRIDERTMEINPVTAHYLLAKNTIEEKLVEVIEMKRSVSAQAVDGDEECTEQSIIDQVIELMLAEEAA